MKRGKKRGHDWRMIYLFFKVSKCSFKIDLIKRSTKHQNQKTSRLQLERYLDAQEGG